MKTQHDHLVRFLLARTLGFFYAQSSLLRFLRRLTISMTILTRTNIVSSIALLSLLFGQKSIAEGEPAVVEPKQSRIRFQTIESRRVKTGGRSVVMNRVAPPILPEAPKPPSAQTAEEIAAAEAAEVQQAPQKRHEVLFLSATVYDRKVTELRWSVDGKQRSAFSNVDFNYFTGISQIETADANFSLIFALDNQNAEQREATDLPALERFSLARAEYFMKEHQGAPVLADEKLAALDALHVYFDANKQRLIADAAKRQAALAEKERQLKEHPPAPKNTVINFWVDEPKKRAQP